MLKNVVASSSEEEYGGLFHNDRVEIPLRQALKDINHPQPATPIFTDNSTANGLSKNTLKIGQSKCMDMRFHWIKYQFQERNFQVFWEPGGINKADYFSKNHYPSHHTIMIPHYLRIKENYPQLLRGCINSLTYANNNIYKWRNKNVSQRTLKWS